MLIHIDSDILIKSGSDRFKN